MTEIKLEVDHRNKWRQSVYAKWILPREISYRVDQQQPSSGLMELFSPIRPDIFRKQIFMDRLMGMHNMRNKSWKAKREIWFQRFMRDMNDYFTKVTGKWWDKTYDRN